MEKWKDIPESDGAYQVSNTGKVKSIARYVEQHNRWGGINRFTVEERIMKPWFGPEGSQAYPRVSLRIDGKYKTFLVHQLVCKAFHGERPEGYQVCHTDGNKQNNNARNLRWGTQEENISDCKKHGGYIKGWEKRKEVALY